MAPQELEKLPAAELSAFFSSAVATRNAGACRDSLAQLETRFHRLCTTSAGSRKFVDDFLPLAGKPELRALHISDPILESVARFEYLLEMAGGHARSISKEGVLRQIVASRERGQDLINLLAQAPSQGLANTELAQRLKTTLQNLSPLLSYFHSHALVNREKRGSSVFNTLTTQARALFVAPEPTLSIATRSPVDYRLTSGPVSLRSLAA